MVCVNSMWLHNKWQWRLVCSVAKRDREQKNITEFLCSRQTLARGAVKEKEEEEEVVVEGL